MRLIGSIHTAVLVLLCLVSARAATGQESVIHDFGIYSGPDGDQPKGRLLIDANGDLYGNTSGGGTIPCDFNGVETGYYCGTVFELSHIPGGDWTEKVIYQFGSGDLDGYFPQGPLISDGKGNLYGATPNGGLTYFGGTVFELSPARDGSWTETVIHRFGSSSEDGANPMGGLTLDAQGNLYGTTLAGGLNNCGTAFELTPSGGSWREKILYNFGATSTDGIAPFAGLVFDPGGNLYGTTSGGGIYGQSNPSYAGTVFELTPQANGSWTEHILHSFNPAAAEGGDGVLPEGTLILDSKGNLYGTAAGGGAGFGGTVFELSPAANGAWTEKFVSLLGGSYAGSVPAGDLTMDSAGNLYGTTQDGGATNYYGGGTVFEFTPPADGPWTENILHSFPANPIDGKSPEGGVVLDSMGNLYGTTFAGGTYTGAAIGGGTVFEIANLATPPIGTVTTLASNPSTNFVAGEPITLTATVTPVSGPAVAAGTVTFADPTGGSATALLIDGKAVYSGTVPSAGTYAVYASYSGAPGFAPSHSATMTGTVSMP